MIPNTEKLSICLYFWMSGFLPESAVLEFSKSQFSPPNLLGCGFMKCVLYSRGFCLPQTVSVFLLRYVLAHIVRYERQSDLRAVLNVSSTVNVQGLNDSPFLSPHQTKPGARVLSELILNFSFDLFYPHSLYTAISCGCLFTQSLWVSSIGSSDVKLLLAVLRPWIKSLIPFQNWYLIIYILAV